MCVLKFPKWSVAGCDSGAGCESGVECESLRDLILGLAVVWRRRRLDAPRGEFCPRMFAVRGFETPLHFDR